MAAGEYLPVDARGLSTSIVQIVVVPVLLGLVLRLVVPAGPATIHFGPAAALPAAIFSVWHNVSGSLLASHGARRDPAADRDERQVPGR